MRGSTIRSWGRVAPLLAAAVASVSHGQSPPIDAALTPEALVVAAGVPDGDRDGIPDADDNCPSVANVAQSDFDADHEGDHCDFDDGWVYVMPESLVVIAWQYDETLYAPFNLYRGDLATLKGQGEYVQPIESSVLAFRDCEVYQTRHFDLAMPRRGSASFFLITAIELDGETSLGDDSRGVERPNVDPCFGDEIPVLPMDGREPWRDHPTSLPVELAGRSPGV